MRKILHHFISIKLSFMVLCGLMVVSCGQENSVKTDLEFNLAFDIQKICTQIPLIYVYFEDRSSHWEQSCQRAKDEATQLVGTKGSLDVLERLLDDLYDPHISLDANNNHSPRLVPTSSDLWVEPQKGDYNYKVVAVRPHSGAANAGLRVGDDLIHFNGLLPQDLAFSRIHSGRQNMQIDRVTWAINAAIAGRRDEPRTIEIRRDSATLKFTLNEPEVDLPSTPVSYRVIEDHIGYIRFNNSLGEMETVTAFNAALDKMRHTDSLILDLRETPSGGDTDIAEPILGRFVDTMRAYQRTVLRDGQSIDRTVLPSGDWTYDKPLIVLVGRWTGSMGEGMAIGFDGMGRAKIIGSKMAGLAGGTKPLELEQTDISVWLPVYDLHHLNGTPRHRWLPPQLFIADNGNEADILMQQALFLLQKN